MLIRLTGQRLPSQPVQRLTLRVLIRSKVLQTLRYAYLAVTCWPAPDRH
jgi:hypothetical protein